MGNKGILYSFLCSLAIVVYVCLVNNIGGLTFVVICFLVMCALFSYYNGMKTHTSKFEKKFGNYVPKENEDIYFDTRLKVLKKKAENKELNDWQYKYERDKLMKEFNEGKVHDRNES